MRLTSLQQEGSLAWLLFGDVPQRICGHFAHLRVIIGEGLVEQRQVVSRTIPRCHLPQASDKLNPVGLIRIQQAAFEQRKSKFPHAVDHGNRGVCSMRVRLVLHQSFQFGQCRNRICAEDCETYGSINLSPPRPTFKPVLKSAVIPDPGWHNAGQGPTPSGRLVLNPFQQARQCIRSDMKHRSICCFNLGRRNVPLVDAVNGEPRRKRASLILWLPFPVAEQDHGNPKQNQNADQKDNPVSALRRHQRIMGVFHA